MCDHAMRRLPSGDYELQVLYIDEDDLDQTLHDVLAACDNVAAARDCSCESQAHEPSTDRSW